MLNTDPENNLPLKYKKVGVLDIGSNSVRFVIYELFGSAFSPIYNEKVLAGLGRELRSTGNLSPVGRKLALDAIARFKIIADAHKLDQILIGATAALREADDAQDFIKDVKDATGLDVTAVSGREEARLTAQGVIAAEPRAKGIVADLGGASLELIHIQHRKIQKGNSYPIGPFQMLGADLSALQKTDIDKIKSRIRAALNQQNSLPEGQNLYLVGGAWRNLASVHQARHLYPLKTIQSYTLKPGAAQDLAHWAYGSGFQDLINWPNIGKRRAETLPYSGLLLDVLLETFAPPNIIFSSCGLREGLIFDNMPETLQRRDALLDGCRDLAHGNLQGEHFAEPLFEFLKPVGEVLPLAFSPDNELRLRRAACHLVGIGKGLHVDYRARLVFADILYAPLAGLTHKERAYLALILFHSYTHSLATPHDAAINLLLSRAERDAARIYGAAMRLAVVATGRSPDLLKEFSLTLSDKVLHLQVAPSYESLLTERVKYRLSKLGQLIDIETAIHSA